MSDNEANLDRLRQAANNTRATAERWPAPTMDSDGLSERGRFARASDYAAALKTEREFEEASAAEARRQNGL